MRNHSSSKQLSAQSSGKHNRAQNQKELRQAQRQTQNQLQLQEVDYAYAYTQAPRTVKNSSINRNNYMITATQDPSPQGGQTQPHGTGHTKSSLQVARAKIMNHHHQTASNQHQTTSNLFGGLSRHLINSSGGNTNNQTPNMNKSTASQSVLTPSGAQGQIHHSRGSGSTGYSHSAVKAGGNTGPANQLLSPRGQSGPKNTQAISQKQYSQHNANYLQTCPTSPTAGALTHQQPPAAQCGRTLAALDSMNQSQLKMRKTESVGMHIKAQKALNNLSTSQMLGPSQPPSKPPANLNKNGSSTQKIGKLIRQGIGGSQQKHGTGTSSQYIQPKSHHQNQEVPTNDNMTITSPRLNQMEAEETSDFMRRSFTALQSMQPLPPSHKMFLTQVSGGASIGQTTNNGVSNMPLEDSHIFSSNQTFARRTALMDAQIQSDTQILTLMDSSDPIQPKQVSILDQEPTRDSAIFQTMTDQFTSTANNARMRQIVKTGSFKKEKKEEEKLQHSIISHERATTPEVTTPFMNKELTNSTTALRLRSQASGQINKMVSVGVLAQLDCHEYSKERAVLQQKVQLLGEQIKEEKRQAKMKEEQYNKIISALERTAEENKAKMKSASQVDDDSSAAVNPNQKDWKDTLDELNKKKEEVNKLQEQVLSLQLREEKLALDHKLALQQKDDEISEEKLKLRHKESDLRQASAQIERLNEDIQGRIQEALDRQSDRLATEKQLDMDAMNRRNEELIKQLIENHSQETRKLRELLLQQERKTRDAEQSLGTLEVELRAAKMEEHNKIGHDEFEEITMQNQKINQLRLDTLKNQYGEENNQLREVIVQLENHINRLQEGKSESDRKLIVAEDKIQEVKKEVSRNKIIVQSQKEKEEKMSLNYKAQIAKERRTADSAVAKLKTVQKLEQELNKKQIQINQLRGKILELERDEMHKSKILLMKRKQIEDEKTVLIKKQALRQRSMTRSNLSATRLQHQLENKQAVIATERESKRALQEEKHKLEKEIASIKREKRDGGQDSSKNNESMSMYFARSQHIFSPRNRGENATKSFMMAPKGSKTSRHQVFMSQQMNSGQLYLSKQFSGERTSSAGGGSIAGGDSMVNIVEFEENTSIKSRGPGEKNNSILSTPFKHDEPNESKLTNLHFKNKTEYSQSVMAQLRQSSSKKGGGTDSTRGLQSISQKRRSNMKHKNATKGGDSDDDRQSLPRVTTVPDSGIAQFQTHMHVLPPPTSDGPDVGVTNNVSMATGGGVTGNSTAAKHFKMRDGKKMSQIRDSNEEAEFMQVLSGCDSSNGSDRHLPSMHAMTSKGKTPGMRMTNIRITEVQPEEMKTARVQNKELQEIKLMSGGPKDQGSRAYQQTKNSRSSQAQNNIVSKGAASLKELTNGVPKQSPNKMHLNMAKVLAEQRIKDSKESFVRTVLTARHECEQFNSTLRQKDEHALTNRIGRGMPVVGKDGIETRSNTDIAGVSAPRLEEKKRESSGKIMMSQGSLPLPASTSQGRPNNHVGPHEKIRHLNRNKTQTQFFSQDGSHNSRSPPSKTPLNYSNDVQNLAAFREAVNDRKMVSDETPVMKEENLKMKEAPSDIPNESFTGGHFLQKLVNLTNSIENGSGNEELSQTSNKLIEENVQLKEQLEYVKQSLVAHQESAANTQMSMMEAIMQMKDQISQVMSMQTGKAPVDSRMMNSENRLQQPNTQFTNQHEDYLVMSQISRNSTDEEGANGFGSSITQARQSKKSNQPKMHRHDSVHQMTESQSARKTPGSAQLRQRSETLNLTQTQAESMYKKIKIKSPNKRANQVGSSGLQSTTNVHFSKQTQSSAMKRQYTQNQTQARKIPSNVSSFNNQNPSSASSISQIQQPSQGFYQTQASCMKQRLSVGVLRQSAHESVRRISQPDKGTAEKKTPFRQPTI